MFENDYALVGEHARKLKYLAKKNSKDSDDQDKSKKAAIFERHIDVYMNAAIFGLLHNRKEPIDHSINDRARINADVFSRERDNCIFLYRLVMLLDESTGLTPEERINRAFRYDVQPEKEEELKKNLELFNSYVRGGIDELYEQFTSGCYDQNDYMYRIYQIMKNFKDEIDGVSFEDKLSEFHMNS